VHGLAKVNDSFLYAASWTNRMILAYKYENSVWTNRTFVPASTCGVASHMAVDDCGRVRLIITDFGLRIYDPSGVEVANWNMASSFNTMYDLLLLPNYVLLLTMRQAQQLVLYDPQVSCS
jgi:hypothetical protein